MTCETCQEPKARGKCDCNAGEPVGPFTTLTFLFAPLASFAAGLYWYLGK